MQQSHHHYIPLNLHLIKVPFIDSNRVLCLFCLPRCFRPSHFLSLCFPNQFWLSAPRWLVSVVGISPAVPSLLLISSHLRCRPFTTSTNPFGLLLPTAPAFFRGCCLSNSIQSVLHSPQSQRTDITLRALQSVHTQHSLSQESHIVTETPPPKNCNRRLLLSSQ